MIQLAMDYAPKLGTILPEDGTQNRTILDALRRGEVLTHLDALNRYGIARIAARVCELKAMNWHIRAKTVTTFNGARVAAYSLGS